MEFAKNGRRIADIEDTCKAMPQTHKFTDHRIPEADHEAIRIMMLEMKDELDSGESVGSVVRSIQRRHHRTVKPSQFTQIYHEERQAGRMERNVRLENALVTKKCRGVSGVSVVTVFLSPYPNGQTFSCRWNCAYCPNEPGQPRSYLFGEPGVLRANQNDFDCVKQMLTRINSYKVNGHPTDKFEVLILGGTIHSYPKSYLEDFMRDIYYGANTCADELQECARERRSLAEEKRLNTAGTHRVIGVTVETRPDCITPAELVDFRRWGVTRVQIGVQHTDDEILRAVNRGCSYKHTVTAMKLLRDNCFKVDIHLMPNLPTATVAKDKAMFDNVLELLHPDQVKVYPCETTPFTKILEDYKTGVYVPYDNDALTDVVLYWKTRVHPWIRNNRIVRDIPDSYIIDGVKSSSQRCEFQQIMKTRGLVCRCIRCREAGRFPDADPTSAELVVRTYSAQDGVEHFISFENTERTILFGFLRLRLKGRFVANEVFPELTGSALIRELHVYGRTISAGVEVEDAVTGDTTVAQHLGFGRRLLLEAERLAFEAGYTHISVISGVGVQNYYERRGYKVVEGLGEFMQKSLVVLPPIAEDYQFILLFFGYIVLLFLCALSLCYHPRLYTVTHMYLL
jgi:ELP3 family radical SAM enzyme/protein acetyltransferase